MEKEEILKISKDKKRAISLRNLAEDRFKDISSLTKPYKIVEEYYEIIKELITAIMYIDGFKTLSHKSLVSYLKDHYNNFSAGEIKLIDELRILRDNVLYYGEKVDETFLINKKERFNEIIKKLFRLL